MTQPRTPRYRIQRITQPNSDISHWVVQRKGLFGWKTETEQEECTHELYPTYISVDKLFCSLDDARQYVDRQTRAQRGPIREVVWESPALKKKEWSQDVRVALWMLLSISSLCGTMLPVIPLATFLFVVVGLVCFGVGLSQ